MSRPDQRKTWSDIARQAKRVITIDPDALLSDARRTQTSKVRIGDFLIDYSHQYLDQDALASLLQLAEECDVLKYLQDVANEAEVNTTEQSAANHIALRASKNTTNTHLHEVITRERIAMLQFAEALRQQSICGATDKPITDVVHIGIGGSHLGPALACEALSQETKIRLHFQTSFNSSSVRVYDQLNPETAMFVIASKSYTTVETLRNAERARRWLTSNHAPSTDLSRHFVHLTANRSIDFGTERVFYFPGSIGGRFSLWSVLGLPIAIAIGSRNFELLLSGARMMDQHVLGTEPKFNAAILLALFTVWNTNFLGATSHLILPYYAPLRLFTRFVQQLEMESNGKSTLLDGSSSTQHTTPVVWGDEETDGQHAWHQMLHQGTHAFSADFIGVINDEHDSDESNRWSLANLLAQSELLFTGFEASLEEPHKAIRGRHSSTILLLDSLKPQTLGALLALYEHKVASLACLWGINPFDQWGVEKGKKLAVNVEHALEGGDTGAFRISTRDLIHTILARRNS